MLKRSRFLPKHTEGIGILLKRHLSEKRNEATSEVRNILDTMLKSSTFPTAQTQAISFCNRYKGCKLQEKQSILKFIAINYDLDYERAMNASHAFLSEHSSYEQRLKTSERLRLALVPKYTELLNSIARLESGMKFIVDMRSDLLELLEEQNSQDFSSHLVKAMNEHLKKVLSFAFSVGFLNLERITWSSSCDMLEKVSNYETVHPMRNWLDLKKRVGPYRRCYVYSHSCMPKEPIVILHTALTQEIVPSIASIVAPTQNEEKDSTDVYEDSEKVNAAIFYSITSTQKGLRGIELGNYLIKKVVGEVLKEFPHITKLSSLSPVPGFRNWLLLEISKAQDVPSVLHSTVITEAEKQTICAAANVEHEENFWKLLYHIISSNRWTNNENLALNLRNPLLRLCAHYLVNVKRRSYAMNSVAHFHLRNGAVLWRLNWKADLSPRGLDNSCGIMVNYRYYMEETEQNSQEYLETYNVKTSEHVAQILKNALK